MKVNFLFLVIFLFFNNLNGQTMRYFQVVAPELADLDWRDSAYVVAASDSALLADIEYELSLPFEQRRHVNGSITAGDGGFNRNADFWFDWHTKPNEWAFADFSVEVCDGRAYTDVNQDTTYWLRTLGYFCGWSYKVAREVSGVVSTPEPVESVATFRPIAPNPVNDEVIFSWLLSTNAEVALTVADVQGKQSVYLPLGRKEAGEHTKSFATSALSDGVYFATLRVGKSVLVQRFVVAH